MEPKDNREYKTKEYWEDRFKQEESYEWLCDWQVVKKLFQQEEFVAKLQDKESKILLVGCGNSDFSFQLASDLGRLDHNVVSIDFSENVIQNMSNKYPQIGWKVMDMTKMEFEDESFDFIIDKAAMDALVTDEGDPWNPNEGTVKSTGDMMKEVGRVLKPGGYFVQISFQQPHFRKKYLSNPLLSPVEVQEIDHGMGYFFFKLQRI